MQTCKQLGLETKEANAMMELEAAYCKLDAAKAEYTKLAKKSKQTEKEPLEKEETPAPEGKRRQENQRNRLISWLLTSSPTHLP